MENAHPLTDRLRHALEAAGLESTVDGEGDLEVEFEGNALFIHIAEDHSAFRVFGRWEVSVEEEGDEEEGDEEEGSGEDGGEGGPGSGHGDELELLRRCNEVNLELLLVKVGLHDGDLVFSVDHALDPATPDAPLDAVLPHLMENLLHGVETFTASE